MIGLPPFVGVACNVWRRARPDLVVDMSEVVQGKDFVFDESTFDTFGPPDVPVFVAIDNRYLNFKRLELMTLLAARGFRLDQVVGVHAVLGEGVTLGDNVLIGEGAVIGDGASIGRGAYLGARAVVGPDAVIAPGAWIEPGVVIGARAQIGTQTTITSGVVIADAVEVGSLCVLAVPGLVRLTIEDRTYLHPAFPDQIRILG